MRTKKSDERALGPVDLHSEAAQNIVHRKLHRVFTSMLEDPSSLDSVVTEFSIFILEVCKLHQLIQSTSSDLLGALTALHAIQGEGINLQRHQGRQQQCRRRIGRDFLHCFTSNTKYDRIMGSCEDLLNEYLASFIKYEGDGITYSGKVRLNVDFSGCRFAAPVESEYTSRLNTLLIKYF